MEGRNVSLDGEWRLRRASLVDDDDPGLQQPGQPLDDWIAAEVPTTVLGAMVDAGVYPEPGAAAATGSGPESAAPDAAAGDVGAYTFWWVRDFELEPPSSGERYWLDLHGVHDRADVLVNGRSFAEGLPGRRRHSLEITAACHAGTNRLAMRVRPPWPPGEGAVADRNTGIWRSLELRVTGPVLLNDPHVVTYVLDADGAVNDQATVMLGAEVFNAGDEEEGITLTAHLLETDETVERELTLEPGERTQAALPDLALRYPDLWWPRGVVAGSGPSLYTVDLALNVNGVVSDRARVRFGIREVGLAEAADGAPRLQVNGRDLFVHAADWAGTDPLLRRRRRTADRYRREVGLLAEAGVQLLRLAGGNRVEDPAFYDACDEMGVMVLQDFPCAGPWGDGAGRPGDDEDSTRDFLDCSRDTMKVLRNHPSLVLWSGGDVPLGLDGDDVVDHCLRCHLTGFDAEGEPCRFVGDTPCDPEGVLDGTRPYLTSPGALSRGWLEVEEWRGAGEAGGGDVRASMVTVERAVAAARARALSEGHGGLHLGLLHDPRPDAADGLYGPDLLPGPTFWGVRRALRPVAMLPLDGEGGGEGDGTGLRVRRTGTVEGPGVATDDAVRVVALAHDLHGRQLARAEADLAAGETGEGDDGPAAPTRLEWPDPPPGDHFLTLELHPATADDDEDAAGEAGGAGAASRFRTWRGGLAALDDLPAVELRVAATVERDGAGHHRIQALVTHPGEPGDPVAFAVELALLAAGGAGGNGPYPVPAVFSDNLFTLLPGESRRVEARCAVAATGGDEPAVAVGGWNVSGARPARR